MPGASMSNAALNNAAADDSSKREEKLKAALWHSIGQTIDAVSLTQNVNATSRFIGALSEMCWAQIDTAAQDLEAFARHDGGRTTIRTADVVLLARRNEGLADLLREESQRLKDADRQRR